MISWRIIRACTNRRMVKFIFILWNKLRSHTSSGTEWPPWLILPKNWPSGKGDQGHGVVLHVQEEVYQSTLIQLCAKSNLIKEKIPVLGLDNALLNARSSLKFCFSVNVFDLMLLEVKSDFDVPEGEEFYFREKDSNSDKKTRLLALLDEVDTVCRNAFHEYIWDPIV